MINYCGTCPHNGNAILTSYPPKIRCELTGKLHYTTDTCDVDMVAVVRCKNCQYYCELPRGFSPICELIKCRAEKEGFCSWGKRKEDADN